MPSLPTLSCWLSSLPLPAFISSIVASVVVKKIRCVLVWVIETFRRSCCCRRPPEQLRHFVARNRFLILARRNPSKTFDGQTDERFSGSANRADLCKCTPNRGWERRVVHLSLSLSLCVCLSFSLCVCLALCFCFYFIFALVLFILLVSYTRTHFL